MKGLKSGSEAVVTVDLILTVRKPERNVGQGTESQLQSAHAPELIDEALIGLNVESARNPSYVYAARLREVAFEHAPFRSELLDTIIHPRGH